jgi:amino acid adenylation domain-containing protein
MNAILGRHDVLRANFSAIKGQPIQSIAPTMSLSLDVVDLSALDAADRENESLRLSVEEALRPFELAKDPLLRAMLFRLAMEDYILLVVMHHIVCDGWSARVFTNELAVLYEAFSTGTTSPLPELPIQYADHAYWQRQRLQEEVFDQQVSYWRDILGDNPPLLDLPTDRPRQSYQTFCGANQTIIISSSLLKLLKALSRKEDVTLFMTLLAAFKVLLYRYTGQMDIVVGSPIAGRSHIETEDLIGFFVNTLVLRTDLSGNPLFRQLLQRIREVTIGAYEQGDLPLEKLVEVVKPERELSQNPFFQVLFNFENVPEKNINSPELGISEFEFDSGMAAFDLSVEIFEKKEELYCLINYNTDIFESLTITRMAGHYQSLLESIVTNPDQRVSDVQILTDTERKQMLVDWNDTSSGYPDDRCVHQLFEQQVEHSPDAVAVVYEDEQLTYRELNARANQLARYLNKLGVGPEVLVGICVQRSLEMVVGLLAIIKAGGAYVPLDPAYPTERLAFMLSDTQTPVLLTQKRLVDKLPVYAGEIFCLDGDDSAIARENAENPTSAATPANLAYVIYTSGSTGQPKGVEIQHGGVVNLIAWHQQTYKVAPNDRATQLASLAFDASVWELWPHLTAGASIHIPNEETRASPPKLLEWLSAEAITLCFMPTPLAESVLEEQLPKSLALRALLTGGDKLHRRPPKDLPFRLVNHYGPTENTVVTTWAPVAPVTEADTPPVIGRPICNTRVYVLDHHLNPVPIGIPGEMYISGDGLARGYLNRPELTAEKFIQNPFSADPKARMYLTGDLARYLPDGNIEFLGRIDNQVKIRGFRIEIGEVESVLGRHPAVEETVVIAREDVPGDKRLVAYVVASPGPALTFSELRSFLKDKLPDYMIPSAFVFLDLLPLTPNGKVNRRALPTPDLERSRLETKFVAPRTQVEKDLAKIWGEMLGLEPVGVHDNFFDLGGHSLLVTQVMSRIRENFEMELPLPRFFETPTIAGLTELIETIRLTGLGPRPYRETTTSDREEGEI